MVVSKLQVAARRNGRPGFTLMEVLVALAIFLMSIIAVARLLGMGSDFCRDANQQTECLRLAQSKMSEVLAYVVALQSDQGTFDEAPEFNWTITANPDPNVNVNGTYLWDVTVTVARQRPDGTSMSVTVSHMILDPSIRGTNVNYNSTTSSGSSSSSSGTSSQ